MWCLTGIPMLIEIKWYLKIPRLGGFSSCHLALSLNWAQFSSQLLNMDNRLLGVKSSPGKGFCTSFGLLSSVSSPQDAIGQKSSSLSAGKMTMNKINEASAQRRSSWWCLQWGVSQHLAPATRSSFYCPKMLLLFCCRSLRYQASRAASLFNTVNVTPQTAVHYHSNEPATMEEKARKLISLQGPFASSP